MGRKLIYPKYSLDDALMLARTIYDKNAGKPIRRLTLFDILNRGPESRGARDLATASGNYGLTKGSYTAEMIELTERGESIAKSNDPEARLDAVFSIDVFKEFFQHYQSAAVPSEAAAVDFLKQQGIPERSALPCLNMALKTGRQVSLVQEISGMERIVSRDHAVEKLSALAEPGGPSLPEADPKRGPKRQTSPTEAPVSEGKRLPSLNINLQIHLPADAKPDVYETIFKNIRRYLMDEE